MTGVAQGADGDRPVVVSRIGTPDADSGEAELRLTPAEGAEALPADWLGSNLVVVITIELLESDSLLVPATAVIPGGTGPAHVEVIGDDGARTRVAVRELGALDGVSAITPLAGDLDVGDLVRIG